MPKRKRNYKKEYREYHASAEQKKRRAQRNKARREAAKKGLVKKGDNKEVHHVNAPRKGKLPSKTKVVDKKTNRKKQPKRGGKKKK